MYHMFYYKPFPVFEMTEQQAAKNRCDWTKKQIVEYKNSFGSIENFQFSNL